jgi:DNA anti-recombination protein RmuC
MLRELDSSVAIAAISRAMTELFEQYRAKESARTLRQIRHELSRSRLPMPDKKQSIDWAMKILEEIAASKKKELHALTETELNRISEILSRILEEKIASEPLYDEDTGKMILDDLRRQYASVSSQD